MSDEPTTEQEWAAYYEGHRDDPAVWGKPVKGRPRQAETLSATVAVRLDPQTASRLRTYAKKWGVGYSEIVRVAVAEFLAPPPEPVALPPAALVFPYTFNPAAGSARTFTMVYPVAPLV